tara:strand:- start:169 stop:345 length:177 start_codon:yes stop_codon:yes gene_type:complete
MKYRGVAICQVAALDKYLFIYDGCPDDYLKDSSGEYLYIKDVTKAEGYIDCLIHLGWI